MNVIRRISLLLLLSLPFGSASLAADYQLVVHTTNPRSSMTREELGKVFLKQILKWDTGIPIIPVDQLPNAPVRVLFTRIVHRKTEGAIRAYWQQQIFAGRQVPPTEIDGDAAVIAFVKANPGAIGYISGGASADGVKLFKTR